MSAIWAKRRVPLSETSRLQDDFEELFMSMNGPRTMMMVSANRDCSDSSEDVFIQLPDASLLGALPGFESIDERELPQQASPLVAQQDAFEERFWFLCAGRS